MLWMRERIVGIFRPIWRTKFETSLALNLFVCGITYFILWAYCVLCLHNVDAMFLNADNVVDEAAKGLYVVQFYVDAFFPSTLTLVIFIIVQNMVEGFQKKGANWSVTAIVVMLTVVYSMICSSLRTELNVWLFVFFTSVLAAACFLSIVQIQQSLRQDLGISGEA